MIKKSLVHSQLDLLKMVDAGQLTELPCPECGLNSVSGFFYGWERMVLSCGSCDFDFMVVNTRKPGYYQPERDFGE